MSASHKRLLVWVGAVSLTATLLPGTVHAADTTAEAAAEALFKQAKKLADEGNYEEACPKFEASQKKAPAAGTLVNLADCFEHEGKVASAWVTYKEAARAASIRKRADWENLSRTRAAALEAKVPKLAIAPASGAERVDLQIARDDVPVSRTEWGVAIPMDPGPHKISASAPGRVSFTKTIVLAANGATIDVQIPALEPNSGSDAIAPVTPNGSPATAPGRDDSAFPPQKTLGLVVGGIGLVGIAVGAVTGMMTLGKRSDAAALCTSYPNGCSDQAAARSLNDDAKGLATVSTISFIAGGALATVGAVLFLTAPKPFASVRIAPSFGSIPSHASRRGASEGTWGAVFSGEF